MAPERPELDGFLTLIERKIAALQALADSYRAAIAVGAFGGALASAEDGALLNNANAFAQAAVGAISYDLPTGIFLNKSLPAAISLLMQTTKKKYTPKEVAAAIKEGGFESMSENFEKMVMNTMYRMKGEGTLLKFKDGWGLASLPLAQPY
jgi:hypothetical protein